MNHYIAKLKLINALEQVLCTNNNGILNIEEIEDKLRSVNLWEENHYRKKISLHISKSLSI